MASINSPHEPSPSDDDDEEEEEEEGNDDEGEEDDDDFQLCAASSSAPGQLPLPPHSEPQPTASARSSLPLPPVPESTSRALIPFTGSFPAFSSPSRKPAIEASADTSKASTADSHSQLNSSAMKSSAVHVDREPDKKAENREHKKRSKNWTRAETLTLISLRTELAPRFAKAGRKSELWDEIAESMQKGPFCRDAQQCRDKWEKLMAGYKEVRDGIKHKDDNPYYEDLHPLLSGRIYKREREQDDVNDPNSAKTEPFKTTIAKDAAQPPPPLPQYPFHSIRNLPMDAHSGPHQPFRAVLMDNHHPPLSSLGVDAHHHQRHSLLNFSMDGKLHPPHILDGLPFRTLHMETCYPRASAMDNHGASADDDEPFEDYRHSHKRGKGSKFLSVTDLHAVQSLLESTLAKQQVFFKELLDGIEKKEELREQMRREREEKWRAEERAQRFLFTEAMQILTQKLGVNNGVVEPSPIRAAAPVIANFMPPVYSPIVGNSGLKRRSKNWKRSEVLQLIKLRGEMEERFAKSMRRAALWGELAEVLSTQGVRRDGKQCREKWDKLMSEYKEVIEGKKEKGDSPYFPELQAALAGGGGLDNQNDPNVSSNTPSKEDAMQT
ncbi:hypothetical protein GOP47_0021289 [Adiantum capillus-veneris]|uniref:Myb-like domain-containing protein n=1 Tax=Adiantum capillus-veneris TaxID=13818 RepID=A0A9D4UCD1_ADICA|nr:hypothetical protein GOP47_0021289 [Adiantum capillus-veneris]